MAKKLGKPSKPASKPTPAAKRPAAKPAPARAAAKPPAKARPAVAARPAARAAAKKPVAKAVAAKPVKPAAKPAVTVKAAAPARPAAAAKPAVATPQTNGTHKPAARNGVAVAKPPAAAEQGRSPSAAAKPMPVTAKPTPVAAKKPAGPADAVAPPPAMKSPAPARTGVKGGNVVAAKIAVNPGLMSGLAAERSTPVVKLAKTPRVRPEPVPVRLPPAPVRSDSKMARNQAGISQRELEHFRDLLYEKRREITGDVSSMEGTALRTGSGSLSTLPMHMADNGTDNYEQEFTLGLVEKDRKLLHDINVALAKIQDGSYGICEGTGKPISKPRLEAQPWAKYSIEHARALERPQFRRAF